MKHCNILLPYALFLNAVFFLLQRVQAVLIFLQRGICVGVDYF